MSSSPNQPASAIPFSALVLTVLLPFACGYFMSYFFRAVNAVVAPNLVAEIGLSASELGLLTAAYLFAFAVFQLPLGVLLDHHGPRKVQAVLLCCAAAGAALFGLAESAHTLALARALIGLGFAGGLMAGFKAVVLWVPEERRALASACVMSFGGLGILVATVPTELAVQAYGWRAVFFGLAGVTVAVAAFIFFIVPERPRGGSAQTLSEQLGGVVQVFKTPVFWRLVPIVAITAGSHIGVQTLWAGPWFRDVAGFDRDGVALYLGIAAVAFLAGTLSTGMIADWFGRRGVDGLTVMATILSFYIGAQILIMLEVTSFTAVIWIVFGMTGQSSVLAYPWLSSYFGAALSGRANTALNLLMFGMAFAVQSAIGSVIDIYPLTEDGGYDPRGYQMAFAIMISLEVLAFIWFFAKKPKLPGQTAR